MSFYELKFLQVGPYSEPTTGYTGGVPGKMTRSQIAPQLAYGGGGGGNQLIPLPGQGGTAIVSGSGYAGTDGSLYVGGTPARNAGNQSTITNFANIVAGSGGGGGGLQGGGGGGTEGKIGWQDQGVGQIAAVLDKASTGVTPDEGSVGRNHRGFLKITDGYAGFLPAVKAKDGCLHVAKQGLIDGHVGGRGGLGIEEKAAGHC